jgi:hypothetical protein
MLYFTEKIQLYFIEYHGIENIVGNGRDWYGLFVSVRPLDFEKRRGDGLSVNFVKNLRINTKKSTTRTALS